MSLIDLKLRDKQEEMSYLSDAQGIKQIRNHCEDFGRSIDALDKEKNKQY
jgi:hypothetical protein